MEPITLCGVIILAFGLWVEFEPIIMKAAKAISCSTGMTVLAPPRPVQKPLYVKYLTGIGT